MCKNEFIEWLDSVGARYQDYSEGRGIDTVFVYGKDEYDKKHDHPIKYKNLYVPYLRLSWHQEDPRELYVRDNGLTSLCT